jgi:ABC-type glutathione transport system ATPase component
MAGMRSIAARVALNSRCVLRSPEHGGADRRAIMLHQPVDHRQARRRRSDAAAIGVSLPEQRVDQLANQLSGGLRRAMIAMALSAIRPC